jgi:hypothetical protein
MKPQFQHQITTSFALWLDYYLLKKGEAFKNYTTNLTQLADDRLMDDLKGFSSPYKQWVFDIGIPGVTVPTKITVDGSDRLKTPTEGSFEDFPFFFDFNNGRVLMPSTATATTVSASYSVKDFNIYVTNETEENLIIESQFNTNSRFQETEAPIPPYDQVLPAIFINNSRNINDPFSLGGEDKTLTDIRCVVMAENMYQLDGVLSIFNDSNKECFAALAFEDHPLNELGEATDFNYKALSDARLASNPSALHHIDRTDVSKLSDRVTIKIDPNTFVGFIDFEILSYRYPRI